jgi:hypothetical protein
MRSRGYGQGKASIVWEPAETIRLDREPESFSVPVRIDLEAQTNFRAKPLEPGTSQVLTSADRITSEQFKAWLASTYHSLYGNWPDAADMALVEVGEFLPVNPDSRMGMPAGASVLRITRTEKQSGKIETFYVEANQYFAKAERDQAEKDEQENFYKTKAKPLPQGWFVSLEGEPSVFGVDRDRRMRNRMEDDFVTTDNGLFVQEFLPAGTVFATIIGFRNQTGFTARASEIIRKVKPELRGCLFKTKTTAVPSLAQDGDRHLVLRPLPFNEGYLKDENGEKDKDVQVQLSVHQRDNTVLGRPRRNRVVIAAGSLLETPVNGQTIPWSVGERLAPPPVGPADPGEKKAAKKARIDVSLKITSSQAGFLRELTHPCRGKKELEGLLQDRFDKHSERNETVLENVLNEIQKRLVTDGTEAMRKFIHDYLEELAVRKWDEKNRTSGRGREEAS